MVALKNLALLAGASSVLAAPQWGNGGWGHHGNVVTQNDVVWTTVMVTVTAGQEPTPTPQAAQPSAPAAQVTQAPQQPEASPSAQASPVNTGSTSGGYMDTVNEWRGKMGLSSLSQDGTLEGNALKTCDDSGGQLNHELNPGSMAQVLAPGDPSDFVKVFVGGWLCEMPSLPGLGSSVCDSMSQGWSYDGQTGHAEILSSKSYSKIGCANASGIWACDLA